MKASAPAPAPTTALPVHGANWKGQVLRAGENYIFQHPQLTRRLLGLLRSVKPVARVGDVVVVTRHADVLDVLSRDQDFSIAMYTPKMESIAGRFILGMQHTPEYEHDVSVFRLAVPRSDMERIRAILTRIVDDIVTQVQPIGSLDVVKDFADPVPARLAAHYFGIPGPDEASMVRWGRALFRELFYNIRNDPVIRSEATQAAADMRRYTDTLIARRGAEGDREDNVLGRMLTFKENGDLGVDDTWIRTYMMGLIIGMLPLTSKAATLAVDAILRRPTMLAAAQAAAREDDEELLWRYVSEAMRLAPQSPGQFRVALDDQVLNAQGPTVPRGTRIFAATQSAMLDRAAFKQPSQVRLDRPQWPHLHFGYGLHSCFGRFISAEAQVPLLIKAILRQPNLRRAPGQAGRLTWDTAFPNSLTLHFDPQ